jgi:hypothetical protein
LKFQGVRFRAVFLAISPAWVALTKKQTVETKAAESLKEIGRRLAGFSLKKSRLQATFFFRPPVNFCRIKPATDWIGLEVPVDL